jgi:CheY-like chemotaxis protein
MDAKLLLAEDSHIIQRVFELTLRQSGISLTVVDNGIDAIRLAEEISPDLVVADVSLPGKDGFEVARELGTPETGRSFPVLILAGSLSPLDEERYRSCGADGVLYKPFESQELIDKVQALLGARAKPEPAPEPVAEERPTPPAEEPWDFSDVLNEVEEGVPTSVSREAFADDLPGGETGFAAEPARSLSLEDFDVSLEDLEEGRAEKEEPMPEREEPMPEREEPLPGAEPPVQEEAAAIDLPEEMKEELFRAEEHIAEPSFDDSPSAVTDLTQAFEELEEVDFLEPAGAHEVGVPQPPPEEAEIPPPPVHPGDADADAETKDVPAPPSDGLLPGEKEFRELFSERAKEIFERVAAETVEKVMWEMMENLAKEFREKIRESVEAVAWEVVPATTEALIREEIARIREEAGKESP